MQNNLNIFFNFSIVYTFHNFSLLKAWEMSGLPRTLSFVKQPEAAPLYRFGSFLLHTDKNNFYDSANMMINKLDVPVTHIKTRDIHFRQASLKSKGQLTNNEIHMVTLKN